MIYKHVIGLNTHSPRTNLGGNTDIHYLISGGVGHFPSVSLRRRPIQLVILISFFFSPASDAGVLPPLWRGKVLPFTVQSRDHLATITDIYVPSFLRPVRGSLAPRLLLSIPRHSMPAFILSIVPWRIALNWQFEREEPRGAMLRPRL